MKRIISLILVILMVFTLIPTNITSATDIADGGGVTKTIKLIPIINGITDESNVITKTTSEEMMTVQFSELLPKYGYEYIISTTPHETFIIYENGKV